MDQIVADVLKEDEAELDYLAEAIYAYSEKEITGEDIPVSEEAKRLICKWEAADELQVWMRERGFDPGEQGYSLYDYDEKYVGSLNIGWPYGIYGESGFTKPVAVQFYDKNPELVEKAKGCGYEVFESIEEFKAFIEKYCIK